MNAVQESSGPVPAGRGIAARLNRRARWRAARLADTAEARDRLRALTGPRFLAAMTEVRRRQEAHGLSELEALDRVASDVAFGLWPPPGTGPREDPPSWPPLTFDSGRVFQLPAVKVRPLVRRDRWRLRSASALEATARRLRDLPGRKTTTGGQR